jgi:hypothetical protein
MRATLALVAIASLVPQTFASIFPTFPVATSTCNGGQTCTVTWDDKNGAPSLAQIGQVLVGLYTGNAQQQTLLQLVTPTAVAATVGSASFTVDPNVGPNSNLYFIRFDATNSSVVDPATNKKYLAFSSKFTLAGMTGKFNATVQQQIDNISSSAGQTTGGTTTTAPSTSKTSAPTTSSTTTTKPNGATSANQVALPLLGGALAAFGLFAL